MRMGNGTVRERRGGNKTTLPLGNGTVRESYCGNKKDRGIAAAALLNHELIQP